MKKLILAVFVFFLTVGSVRAEGPSGGNVLSTANGNYVFGQTSQMRSDQFMLETKTGRLWMLTNNSKAGGLALIPVLYQISPGQYSFEPPKR